MMPEVLLQNSENSLQHLWRATLGKRRSMHQIRSCKAHIRKNSVALRNGLIVYFCHMFSLSKCQTVLALTLVDLVVRQSEGAVEDGS